MDEKTKEKKAARVNAYDLQQYVKSRAKRVAKLYVTPQMSSEHIYRVGFYHGIQFGKRLANGRATVPIADPLLAPKASELNRVIPEAQADLIRKEMSRYEQIKREIEEGFGNDSTHN